MDSLKARLQTIFPELDESVINIICQNENAITYPEKYLLCKQGSVDDTAYIVLEGSVEIYHHAEGQMHYADSIAEGFVGELALLLDIPRSADVVAAETVTVLEITRAEFERYGRVAPELIIFLSKAIVQRTLKQVDTLLTELTYHRKRIQQHPRFFVSYSRKDEIFVRVLANDLRRRGISLWFDVYDIDPGESWSRQIGRALDECEMMILILSQSSLDSENVDDEWNYYLDVKKTVIPVLLEKCTLPFRLHKLQYVNFVDGDYEKSLNQLVAYLSIQDAAVTATVNDS